MLKYRLKKGQKFDIVSNIRIKTSLLKKYKIFDEKISFVVKCKVAERFGENYKLICRIVNLKSTKKNSSLVKFFQPAVNDKFVVIKNSRGEISNVSGGKKIKNVIFGLKMKPILLWFGTILSSPDGKKKWSYKDENFVYNFQTLPNKKFKGKNFPRISMKCKLKEISILSFPVNDFQCSGEVLFDTESGRIAVSKKKMKCKILNFIDVDLEMESGEKKFVRI